MATYYLDYIGGNNANDGTSYANRWKSLAGGTSVLAAGDTVRVMKSPDPVVLSPSATFTAQSDTVTLASAVTTHISTCEVNWTPTANTTTGTSTDAKQGTYSAQIIVNAAHNGGKAAYLDLGTTLDLSAYTKISFWFKVNAAVLGSKIILKLCTDTIGDVAAHTFVITADRSFPNNWMPFTFLSSLTPEAQTYLSSNIQSIAVYTDGSIGDVQISLDNILACNDLTLTCTLSDNSSTTSLYWYAIRSIDGTTIRMENEHSRSYGYTGATWHGITQTKPIALRETIRVEISENTSRAGAPDGLIELSCGWDQASMSVQNGLTMIMIDAGNTCTYKIAANNWLIKRLCLVYYNETVTMGQHGIIEQCGFTGGQSFTMSARSQIKDSVFTGLSYYGIVSYGLSVSLESVTLYSLGDTGIFLFGGSYDGQEDKIKKVLVRNASTGVYALRDVIVESVTAENCYYGVAVGNNSTTQIGRMAANSVNVPILASQSLAMVQNLSTTNPPSGSYTVYGKVMIGDLNGTGPVITTENAYDTRLVQKVASPVHGTATLSMKHTPKVTHYNWMPLTQRSQPFAVKGGNVVTCKVWVQRSNTNVLGRIRVPAAFTKNLNSDVTATMNASAGNWQELTVTFSPADNTIAYLEFESYVISTSSGDVFFGDVTVSQA